MHHTDLHYVWDEDNNEFVRDSWNAQTHGDIFMLSGCMNVQVFFGPLSLSLHLVS